MGSVLIVGSLNMDLVISVEQMPKVGETVHGKNLTYSLGGKGANQAAAAGKLGGSPWMLGCVGEDRFGEQQRKVLTECGTVAEYMKIVSGEPTGTAVIYVDPQGNNQIVVAEGANGCCDISYIEDNLALLQQASHVLLQWEIPDQTIGYVLQQAKRYGKCTILNPAPAPAKLPDHMASLVDYLTPNETELMKLAGMTGCQKEDYIRAARHLLERGVKNVIVTLGDQGALHVKQGSEQWYPARRAEAVDTTAAGDCFNGALAAGLAQGKSEKEAILYASAASSIAVTRPGALSAIPNQEEVAEVLAHWEEAKMIMNEGES